jgi:hypothetical protein
MLTLNHVSQTGTVTYSCNSLHHNEQTQVVTLLDINGLATKTLDHGKVFVMNGEGRTVLTYVLDGPTEDDFSRDTLSTGFTVE